MVTIEVSTKPVTAQKTTCYSFLAPEGFSSSLFDSCEKKLGIAIGKYLKKQKFTGKLCETFSLPVIKDNTLFYIVIVGLGKIEKIKTSLEPLRRALGTLYKSIALLKEATFAVELLPVLKSTAKDYELGKQITTILLMVAYRFQDFFSNKDNKETEVSHITLCVGKEYDVKEMATGIRDGEYIARAVNKTRHWVNLPPSDLTPPELAEKAKTIAKVTGLKVTVFNEKEINAKGMGGLAAVGRGSDHECRFVILEYKAPQKNAPTIAFVGKGITFDSGGLSIKPAQNMETMKEDMAGAAAVLNIMEALAHLKPKVNVIGITPLAENLPGSKATKPGDIVRFYNGKTAEVKNTDAEGRLILADALSYATKHYKPDVIIDIATLTGACAYALGPFFTGLLSEDDKVADKIIASAHASGDPVWRLPLTDDYSPAIKSDVADLANIGSPKYMAGAITAASFLKHFVNDTPWAHLDIAGTASSVPDIPYFRSGATGVGVRLLIDFAMNWQ